MCGDGVGLVNVPALKGIHYAVESGRLAAEAAWRALGAAIERERSRRTTTRCATSFVWSDLREVRNMRQAFGARLLRGGALAGRETATKGQVPAPATGRPSATPRSADRHRPRRVVSGADGKLTFDKLSSVFLSGNRTRDDQPNHIRVQTNVPRELGELWAHMCPAQVYEVGEADGDGMVEVKLTPSNCVQCGAITAKGGRLTPPEGGTGPEYTLT